MSLLSIPKELLDRIALDSVLLSPLGPPAPLIPLLLTSRTLYTSLSPTHNPSLAAHIFKSKFDTSAPLRRLGHRALRTKSLADQLVVVCSAMQRLRRGDIWADADVITAHFWTAYLMMLENDGRNACQLKEWAGVQAFVDTFVRRRLWEGRDVPGQFGWPVDNEISALAVSLMWLTIDAESLAQQTVEQRREIIHLMFPYMIIAFRYPAFHCPDNHFTFPFPSTHTSNPDSPSDHETEHILPHSIETAHGSYPLYILPSHSRFFGPPSSSPSPSTTTPSPPTPSPPSPPTPTRTTPTIPRPHFSSTLYISPPLLSPPSSLLYFSHQELELIEIPPHIPLNRAHALSLGITRRPCETREDYEELMRFPHAKLPVCAREWDWRAAEGAGEGEGEGSEGKGGEVKPPSMMWDADWERLNNCWDPWFLPTHSLPTTLYTPGTLTGLWQGRMLVPNETTYTSLISHPYYPPAFSDYTLFCSSRPLYMRLREHCCVSPMGAVRVGGEDGVGVGGGGGVGGGAGGGGGGMGDRMGRRWAWDEGVRNGWLPRVKMRQMQDKLHIRDELGKESIYETYVPGKPSSHDEDTCEECARRAVRAVEREEARVNARVNARARKFAKVHERERERVEVEVDERPLPAGFPDRTGSRAGGVEGVRRMRLVEEAFEDAGLPGAVSPRWFGVGVGVDPDAATSSSTSTSYLDPRVDEYADEDEELDEDADEAMDMDMDMGMRWDGREGEGVDVDMDEIDFERELKDDLDDDEEAEREMPCDGVQDIIITGSVDERHAAAWIDCEYYGRVRAYDGLIAIVRVFETDDTGIGIWVFRGYINGGQNFSGRWRARTDDLGSPPWEGPWTMSKRVGE